MIKTIDTFKDFQECFEDNLNISVAEKIDLWEKSYIHKYPELEAKCKSDYDSNGYSWKDIASIKDYLLMTVYQELRRMG